MSVLWKLFYKPLGKGSEIVEGENSLTPINTMLSEKNSCVDAVWNLFCLYKYASYLKIGYGIWGGEPGSAGILLVAEGSIEGLSDGAQVEGTDCWSRYAVPEGSQDVIVVRSL